MRFTVKSVYVNLGNVCPLMADVLNNTGYIKTKWGNKGGKKTYQVNMTNGNFTGLPTISYYFTISEELPKKWDFTSLKKKKKAI